MTKLKFVLKANLKSIMYVFVQRGLGGKDGKYNLLLLVYTSTSFSSDAKKIVIFIN